MFRKVILPILALIGFGFAVRTVAVGNKPPPIAPAVVEPAKPPFPAFVAGAGIVEAMSENIAVATPVSGVVSTVLITVGQSVKAGDPLFQLDDRELNAQLATKTASLQVADAELQDARNQLALWQAVGDRRAVSADDMTKRKSAVAIAEAKQAQAKAEVEAVKTDLDRIIVRAPVDGELLQSKVRVGEFAPAQVLSTPLMVVGTVATLHVRVDIDETDAWRVKPGAKGMGFLRGNTALKVPLEFVRFEPYVVPKRSLTGDSSERVDTRVLQVIYRFEPAEFPIYVGQLLDVYIDAPPAT